MFFIKLENNLQEIGLRIKREECKMINGDIDVSCLPNKNKRVEIFKAVGVPVGNEEFVIEFLEHYIIKYYRAY